MIYPATHPFWPILRMSIAMGALVLLLWLSAAKFDETEAKVVAGMFLVVGSGESVIGWITRKKPESKPGESDAYMD